MFRSSQLLIAQIYYILLSRKFVRHEKDYNDWMLACICIYH